jgi:hypothetical protein
MNFRHCFGMPNASTNSEKQFRERERERESVWGGGEFEGVLREVENEGRCLINNRVPFDVRERLNAGR